ncbi:hypothetical protein QE152_g24431 [Popillia japonica]|uniref:Uncharacterized protein n=1 Tax=Popillia japonica TaxID=7064 RepID=A0AAW1KGM8_POPJA
MRLPSAVVLDTVDFSKGLEIYIFRLPYTIEVCRNERRLRKTKGRVDAADPERNGKVSVLRSDWIELLDELHDLYEEILNE